ncbi:calcium-binding protein CP1-like [Zingiber officinale]|uniref:EF-hand domain-containing protein n=1 Tax=Zingiber officinale TaxID=94328 RepID=A0A8J5FC26_ZINOF|nr:calcium-binding protein CP1-like [Zingiber officinale]XP_042429436.1 calcium-binding protein CP1-like [Zingiber officinale]KAG6483973.1 hypothetical protein ZIOFF_060766 [Zingiber officinale]KAG6487957.1 hypothetical protein ZIOFF_056696 [Zingiber officinale]
MCPSGRPHRSDPSPSAASRSLRPAFDVLDADRDGRISRDDLKAFFSSSSGLGAAPLSEEDIASMISAADADRNGLVEFEEFERILCGGGGGGSAAVLAEAFGVMDRDGDGKLGFGDLKAYLEMAGLPADDNDVRGMIRMAGGDATDGVSFDSLLMILAVDFSGAA